MKTLRRDIQLKDGVKVGTLFTPHLFSYREEKGLKLEINAANLREVIEVYADIYYLAALNAWELDAIGAVSEFPYTRGDFHEYAAANPKAFALDVDFAVQALTGKTAKELVAEGGSEEGEAGKKKRSRLTMRR